MNLIGASEASSDLPAGHRAQDGPELRGFVNHHWNGVSVFDYRGGHDSDGRRVESE